MPGLHMIADFRSNRWFEKEEILMTWRTFRLHEAHKRIDETLRMEQRRTLPNPFEIMRLKKLKLAIKDRLAKVTRTPKRA